MERSCTMVTWNHLFSILIVFFVGQPFEPGRGEGEGREGWGTRMDCTRKIKQFRPRIDRSHCFVCTSPRRSKFSLGISFWNSLRIHSNEKSYFKSLFFLSFFLFHTNIYTYTLHTYRVRRFCYSIHVIW